ncbi:hypothetical protein GPECTOR_9g428 [Gonium pectorale]|uniref:Uncharacterized protein n=1 Tax=Gonium pectorale TaxID=33097 RepID=A0A150GRG6_GONPE|nr:hypothetical protein GPECTOR_9g428 [Gonium pectorale]|eukprot:KXZ52384.1 hypothetical protein GPECTOR_9g428 [Gonium pectorale]
MCPPSLANYQLGCGASTDNGKAATAPVAAAPADAKPSVTATPAAEAAPAAAPAPAPKDGSSEWHLLTPVNDISQATAGAPVPGFWLVVHDNKDAGLPRLSVVSVANGSISPVRVKDKGRGLADAVDLECLFMVDAGVAGKKQPLYCAMTSAGKAWLFKLSMKKKKWVAHGVKAFEVPPPVGNEASGTNCEGARAYMEDGKLWLEYANRGGRQDGVPLKPWVARTPLDIRAIRKGEFEVDPAAMDVTYWPESIDNDPDVRQCADIGQAVGMARYGQLFAAAKDDEVNEVHFVSYIVERLPGAQTGGVENFKPLYRLQGSKIEAIYDITKDVSIFATDDEGYGSWLTVLHRHSGAAWKVRVVPPEGHALRAYGISGISPADPAIRKEHDDSSSESDQSSEEEEEEEEQAEEEQEGLAEQLAEALEDAMEEREAARERKEELEAREDALEAREDALEAREEALEAREEAIEDREEAVEERRDDE